MLRNKTYNRKKILIIFICCFLVLGALAGRLIYLMLFQSEYYQEQADALHERERSIKAARGKIIDANGTVLATNRTVCTISVIHSQIKEPEVIISKLSEILGMDEETVRKRVEKNSSIERIKTNVDKEIGDEIRNLGLAGVKVDEDFKRYYPYSTLASKVLGFTGSDNQGIIGLEVKYEEYLKGIDGTILTLTDARGVEIADAGEDRIEPVPGNDLYISLDSNIQKYCEQAAQKVMEQKSADAVSVLVMNPQNGEIMAMVNVPEFDLNDPFTLNTSVDTTGMTEEQKQDLLNQMWRNRCINDTYEPGSTFKIITAASGLEEGVVHLDDQFSCPGFRVVEDRRIRCHKAGGHGGETFVQGIMNSCNPVFIDVGLRLGVDNFYKYFNQLGLLSKTGVDLPGEAATIMHKKDNVGPVELATISFGQSFQITPIQLATTVSSIINGGTRITPHLGVEVKNTGGDPVKTLTYPTKEHIISEETSETMQYLLEQVVKEGSGNKAYIPGYKIGGKTATSQTLPRSAHKYISSFLGFAPADDPQVLCLLIINNPQGIYYGGTIAAPIVKDIFGNILPYMGIEQRFTEEETQENNIGEITMPDLMGKTKEEMQEILKEFELGVSCIGEEGTVTDQFPLAGETISKTSNVIVYLE
ncbi:penicillin-binding transpeptidase domain-containing protein [Diplocloster agilis]|uniref:PASTA domain-containing protein n=1 Tax=Diplocloster agilis TaxID=2850323 RepID=A0A949K877_9FIRM|nr:MULTISPECIES: penicillin-binding transpeptidase domain-containing protein [Lachnospiraceae]MBU9738718.1 PASTA domain-containing protein [Diplocloster agilis]MBU9745927.1 PASTA domain-containing protein [Diplocloster agilis]MCU6734083.1 penicillin-binding transpeptidase domain-containing protein [Suonthocola fibrivorans]SCJ23231.1 Penicillin-binding protein 2 [uncultured Clostridium sp.]